MMTIRATVSVFQGDHHVSGGLRAEDEPGHRAERLPGERAGREGEPAGVGPEAEGRGPRWDVWWWWWWWGGV